MPLNEDVSVSATPSEGTVDGPSGGRESPSTTSTEGLKAGLTGVSVGGGTVAVAVIGTFGRLFFFFLPSLCPSGGRCGKKGAERLGRLVCQKVGGRRAVVRRGPDWPSHRY